MPHRRDSRVKGTPHSRRLTLAAALRADTRASTAIEYALLAIPFLLLVFALLEIGLMFVLGVNLSNASATLGRQIRVGTLVATGVGATTSNGSQIDVSDFKNQICRNIQLIPNGLCMSHLQVDLRTISSFQAGAQINPISGGVFNQGGLCFYSGAPGSIVEMHTYYLWPIVTPVLLSMFANVTSIIGPSGTTSGSWAAPSAVQVFVNEPNTTVSNPGTGC